MRFAQAIALDDALEERMASAAHAGRKAARAADPKAKLPKDVCGKKNWDHSTCNLRPMHRGGCSWSWTRRVKQKALPLKPDDGSSP